MKTIRLSFFSFILITSLFLSSSLWAQMGGMTKQTTKGGNTMKSEGSMKVHDTMRKLWSDHIMWTRNVVLCIVDELPGKDQAVQRLLKNQDDIGNAIKPYYGNDAGGQLTKLLYDHINIAAEVVTAAKSNSAALDEANKRWFKNADDIAAFLSKANTNWSMEEMKKMMHDHLNVLNEQVVARVKKDYNADVQAFDRGYEQILEMADMLADGIVKQFPDKFKDTPSSSQK